MKNVIGILSLCLLVVAGCKKDTAPAQPTYTKYPAPNWKAVDNTGVYPATMTAIVLLPTKLQAGLMENDEVAAFINDECRAVGTGIKVDSAIVYFLLIRGKPEEQVPVVFKYYSSKSGYIYQSKGDLTFVVDKVFGTAAKPELLELNPN